MPKPAYGNSEGIATMLHLNHPPRDAIQHRGPKNTEQDGMTLTDLLAVMEDLLLVLRLENDQLRTGLPASVTLQTARKTELTATYFALRHLVLSQVGTSPELGKLHNRLLSTAAELDLALRENLQRLNTAINATRRRVSAVMAAIRDTAQNNRPYTARGYKQAGAPLAGSTRLHV